MIYSISYSHWHRNKTVIILVHQKPDCCYNIVTGMRSAFLQISIRVNIVRKDNYGDPIQTLSWGIGSLYAFIQFLNRFPKYLTTISDSVPSALDSNSEAYESFSRFPSRLKPSFKPRVHNTILSAEIYNWNTLKTPRFL